MPKPDPNPNPNPNQVCLPIAPMLLPPLAMAAVRTVLPLTGLAAVAAETCFVAGSIFGALPLAIAIFPQARHSARTVHALSTR